MTSLSFEQKKNMTKYINDHFDLIAQKELYKILCNNNFTQFTKNNNVLWITVDDLPDNILSQFYDYYIFIHDRELKL